MNTIPLYEDSNSRLTMEQAYLITYCWSHGLYANTGDSMMEGPVYYTVVHEPNGTYTLTNKYDPRVVRWLEENNVV